MFNKKTMTQRALSSILFISLISMALSSCKILTPYQSPEVITKDHYRDIASTDTNTIAHLSWKEVFRDSTLQNLIQKGLNNNLDILSAYTRIQQAQAYFKQSKAAFLPDLILNGSVNYPGNRNSSANNNSKQALYSLGVSSVWELDIWGRLNSSKKAELANLLQTEATARAIQTSIIANIANYYYQLLAMDQQLQITKKTVENWNSTVTTMRALKEAATVTEAAVVQSEAQRYAAEVTIPDLKQAIREIENTLSILLGSTPGSIKRSGDLDNQRVLSILKTGVPSQLLANRPDVIEAELNFRKQFELTNVARASFYPRLSITGSAGYNLENFNNFLDPALIIANIGGGLTQPIFNRRALRTQLEVAVSQQEEALLNFKNTLLVARKEVSDALYLYETAEQKMTVRTKQTDALEKSVKYSQELLENGFANYTEVITARQSLLQAELASVNDHLQQLNAVVDLYRSLGGGWK